MTQWKWRFLGMFYAHMSIRLGLWQGGELRQWRRACGERLARLLLYVLFGLSSMCYWNRMLSVNGSCIFLLCFRGSHWTIAGKSGWLACFLAAETNGKVVLICFSEQLWPKLLTKRTIWKCFHILSSPHDVHVNTIYLYIDFRMSLFCAKWVCTCQKLSTKVKHNLVTWWCSSCLLALSEISLLYQSWFNITFHSLFCSNSLSAPSGGLFWPFSVLSPINTAWCANRHQEHWMPQAANGLI